VTSVTRRDFLNRLTLATAAIGIGALAGCGENAELEQSEQATSFISANLYRTMARYPHSRAMD
jgi:hypothetical protein